MHVISQKITVLGSVQMVGFRWYAKQHADLLGIKGYAKNNSRGTVEIVAQGEKENIELFLEYIKQGPSRARVDRVTIEPEQNEKEYNQFLIRM
jgi:acylphosphatase